jgi:hypothetical protein
MLKKLQFLFVLLVFASVCFAQPKINEGFETSDSINLPTGWTKWNNASFPIDPFTNWTVRDTGSLQPGLSDARTVAHSGTKSCAATWLIGEDTSTTALGVGDAWLVTKKVENITANDVLKFWMTGGSATWDDSLQVWLSFLGNTPQDFLNSSTKLMDKYFPAGSTYGLFVDTSFSLAAYAGSDSVWVGFRYYMDLSNAGFVVTVDDIWLGDPTSVQQIGNNIPDKFALKQNYPNPFNPTTTIQFDLAKNTDVTLIVFNSLGQEVARVFEGYKQAGSYEADFDASKLSSGTYYYRLTTDNFVDTKKMMLIK